MDRPFQLLRATRAGGEASSLLAACGSHLFLVSLKDGTASKTWSSERSEPKTGKNAGQKRKLDDVESDGPAIIDLLLTPDQAHVVVVTEDKCIRVFSFGESGEFKELSARTMPKRPCATIVSDDSQSIICADKFGDCYSLPLIPTEGYKPESTTNGSEQPKTFTPAATELTVHTQRNRKALEEQLRVKDRTQTAKEPLAFEHKLLLGHVSMLTDMVMATDPSNGARYIITSDRDEHIRVSRGPPQAYIIENFCMGHTEFLHKLLVIPGTTTLLSAGGDTWMGVWDWKTGKLLAKHDLRQLQQKSADQSGASEVRIAVENLWLVKDLSGQEVVLVKVEGSTTLGVIAADGVANLTQSVKTVDCAEVGNIIDLVAIENGKMVASTEQSRLVPVQLASADDHWSLSVNAELGKMLVDINAVEVARPPAQDAALQSVERLRKTAYDEQQDD